MIFIISYTNKYILYEIIVINVLICATVWVCVRVCVILCLSSNLDNSKDYTFEHVKRKTLSTQIVTNANIVTVLP